MTDKSLKKISYTLLTGPAILIYASAIIFPIVYSLVLSFTQWEGVGALKFSIYTVSQSSLETLRDAGVPGTVTEKLQAIEGREYLTRAKFLKAAKRKLGEEDAAAYEALLLTHTKKISGFTNYIKMFSDPKFLHGLRNNIAIIAVSVFGQLPIGFVLAYILHRKLVRGKLLFETMIFLPVVLSPIVVAILFRQFFSPDGMFTTLMRWLKNDPSYIMTIFQDKTWAILPVLGVILWMYTGIYMVVFLANLQKISPSVIESAVIDGASELQILWRIILPSMIGVLFTTSVFAIAGSMKSFDLIWAMTKGGPSYYTEVIAIYMYKNTFTYHKYGFGSAVSVVIVLLSMGLVTLLQKIFANVEKKYGAA